MGKHSIYNVSLDGSRLGRREILFGVLLTLENEVGVVLPPSVLGGCPKDIFRHFTNIVL